MRLSAEGRMSAESRCVEDNVSIGLLKLSCTMEEEEEEEDVVYVSGNRGERLLVLQTVGTHPK